MLGRVDDDEVLGAVVALVAVSVVHVARSHVEPVGSRYQHVQAHVPGRVGQRVRPPDEHTLIPVRVFGDDHDVPSDARFNVSVSRERLRQ